MEDKLQDLEQFFNYNLQIKQMISVYPDIYSEEDTIEYVDKMTKNLQDIKYMLTKILKKLGNDERLIEYLNKLFTYYEKCLLNCNYNPQKLKDFYQTCISNMDPQLINEINQEICGYYIFSNYHKFFLQSKTINELLHVLHMYIVNTESFYQKMPIIKQKVDENIGTITLYGRDNPLAEALFENINFNIDSRRIDILSLSNNRILIMARDLGHALTIEIAKEKSEYHVSYFIPKVCNIDMVNNLKGITPIKIKEDTDLRNLYAKGSFLVNEQELIPNLLELMMSVPQDKDMFIEGGIFANNTRK